MAIKSADLVIEEDGLIQNLKTECTFDQSQLMIPEEFIKKEKDSIDKDCLQFQVRSR